MKPIPETHVSKFNEVTSQIRQCLETTEQALPEGAWRDSILLALNAAYMASIAAVATAGGKSVGATTRG